MSLHLDKGLAVSLTSDFCIVWDKFVDKFLESSEFFPMQPPIYIYYVNIINQQG